MLTLIFSIPHFSTKILNGKFYFCKGDGKIDIFSQEIWSEEIKLMHSAILPVETIYKACTASAYLYQNALGQSVAE